MNDTATSQSREETIKIDVEEVLKQRLPRHNRFIPRFLVRWLERTICQEQLNDFLSRHGHERDARFCRSALEDFQVNVEFYGVENIPPKENRKVLFVSNHPLGGLDGIALIDFVSNHYGVTPRFVVNDLLSAVTPLNGVFIPVNKHGSQSRASVEMVDAAFDSDVPMIMFPAGLVSRRQKGGVIRDLEWQKMFVIKARQSRRDIIPIRFCGENSSFFYKFAKFREGIGLKFNIEMIYLPKEIFRSCGKSFKAVIGRPIPVGTIDKGNPREIAAHIKETVYALTPPSEH